MVTTRLLTIDEFATETPVDGRFELVRGELREVAAAGGLHGEVGSEFHVRIGGYGTYHGLGKTYLSETGFILARGERPIVVMPDVAFVRRERLPAPEDRVGYMPVVPDLVVEVVSPNDRYPEIAEKIALYMAAGVPILWLADSRTETVAIHRPGLSREVVGIDGVLSGEEILPGLEIRVADVFVR